MIELDKHEVWLIEKKFKQLQRLQQQVAVTKQDLSDLIRQLLKFKGLPEEYDLMPPDEQGGWRLVEQKGERNDDEMD